MHGNLDDDINYTTAVLANPGLFIHCKILTIVYDIRTACDWLKNWISPAVQVDKIRCDVIDAVKELTKGGAWVHCKQIAYICINLDKRKHDIEHNGG